jgi:hypothetical protein
MNHKRPDRLSGCGMLPSDFVSTSMPLGGRSSSQVIGFQFPGSVAGIEVGPYFWHWFANEMAVFTREALSFHLGPDLAAVGETLSDSFAISNIAWIASFQD